MRRSCRSEGEVLVQIGHSRVSVRLLADTGNEGYLNSQGDFRAPVGAAQGFHAVSPERTASMATRTPIRAQEPSSPACGALETQSTSITRRRACCSALASCLVCGVAGARRLASRVPKMFGADVRRLESPCRPRNPAWHRIERPGPAPRIPGARRRSCVLSRTPDTDPLFLARHPRLRSRAPVGPLLARAEAPTPLFPCCLKGRKLRHCVFGR